MGYSQDDKLLRIRTILDDEEKGFDGDPLLLVKLNGTEGISRLFSYDIVMLRDAGGLEGDNRPPLDCARLIGTPVYLGARPYLRHHVLHYLPGPITRAAFLYRFGMFETIEEVMGVDITHLGPIHWRDFRIYRAHVVPWVKVLGRDVCYRIFENKNVVEIINAIRDEAQKTFPNLHIDTSDLEPSNVLFPKMEYCVQFGESTLDFISRLMARFGIWYFFTHKQYDDSLLNETMVLRGSWIYAAPPAREWEVKIADDLSVYDIDTVAKLVRRYAPPERRAIVGGFNYLDPTNPFYKDAAVDPGNDLWRGEKKGEKGPPKDSRWFAASTFAEPIASNADADKLAQVGSYQNQARVITLSGISRIQSFLPGHTFHVVKNDDDDPADLVNQDFVIDTYSVTCHDFNYINLAGWQLPDFFFPTFSTLETESVSLADAAASMVSMWINNNAQNQVPPVGPALRGSPNPSGQLWSPTIYQTDQDPNTKQNTTSVPLWQAALNTTLWLVAQNIDIKKVLHDIDNQAAYANSFTVFSARAPNYFPLPLSSPPVARGPHTAVVIGPDDGKGVDTSQHDLYCDAIGRVRVRFPWDPGPAQGDSKLPPVFPVSQPDKPTKVGGNTCWVRVVEGWAGRQYGTQFLPRIGQEVLVDFLDGDPERPVIVGRLYNADKGRTNLPFPDPAVKDTRLDALSDLPATAKVDLPLSGIKTWSIPTTDSGGSPLKPRFHLLRFYDKRDHEQYLIRSQGRTDVTTFGSYFDTTGGDRHVTIGGPSGGGNMFVKTFGEYDIHVVKSRLEKIDLNYEMKVGGDAIWNFAVDRVTSVGFTDSVMAGEIVLSAIMNITLMVGASTIVITPAGISISAPTINLVSPAILSTVPVVPAGAAVLPPIPPSPANPTAPTDPSGADPGDTLTPPE